LISPNFCCGSGVCMCDTEPNLISPNQQLPQIQPAHFL
jgi:hypothetical protein